jgi:D-3-phosphoglycerate dehydrogenase
MVGRVGTAFGEQGVNISSAAVGHAPDDRDHDGLAVMVVTTDQPVRQAVVDELTAADGFVAGRAVELT